MNNHYYGVVMAGGVGSRFWPVSTKQNPKQFHDMLGKGVSLIQKTFSRLEQLIPAENICIATNKDYESLVLEQLPNVNKSQLFLEPAMRNTAPCILATALKIYAQDPEAVILVAPSDHWIELEDTFTDNIETSFKNCQERDILMTLGIKPSHPNTGYGYIQYETESEGVAKVKQFTEKPELAVAEKFIAQGDYLWNAGIFVWSAKSILAAFEKNLPEMLALFQKDMNIWNTENEAEFLETYYPQAENISIDFGIMEKADNVFVLPVDFGWNDLGTWGSLYDKIAETKNENVSIGGEVMFRNSKGNIIRTQDNKHVVVQGLNDYIVVEKEGVLLICPKKDEQEIKAIVKDVKEKFGDSLV